MQELVPAVQLKDVPGGAAKPSTNVGACVSTTSFTLFISVPGSNGFGGRHYFDSDTALLS